MKKFLGNYKIENNKFINVKDDNDVYSLDEFMRHEGTHEGIKFHGHASETNTSALVCCLDEYGESAKIYRIW